MLLYYYYYYYSFDQLGQTLLLDGIQTSNQDLSVWSCHWHEQQTQTNPTRVQPCRQLLSWLFDTVFRVLFWIHDSFLYIQKMIEVQTSYGLVLSWVILVSLGLSVFHGLLFDIIRFLLCLCLASVFLFSASPVKVSLVSVFIYPSISCLCVCPSAQSCLCLVCVLSTCLCFLSCLVSSFVSPVCHVSVYP